MAKKLLAGNLQRLPWKVTMPLKLKCNNKHNQFQVLPSTCQCLQVMFSILIITLPGGESLFKCSSSYPENFTEKLTGQMMQPSTFLKKRIQHVFSCEFYQIFWNSFFLEHLQVTTSRLDSLFSSWKYNSLKSESYFWVMAQTCTFVTCMQHFVDILMSLPPSLLFFFFFFFFFFSFTAESKELPCEKKPSSCFLSVHFNGYFLKLFQNFKIMI